MAKATALFSRALKHHQNGDRAAAFAGYQAVLAADPHHADALHLLGSLAHEIGQNDTAISLITAAIASDPGPARYHNDLGEVYRASGLLTEAAACYERAISRNRRLASAHNNLGLVRRAQGQRDLALSLFEKAAKLEPHSVDLLNNWAAMLIEAGQIAAARAVLARGQDLAPLHDGIEISLGNAELREDAPESALQHYQNALARQPDSVEARLNLACALKEQGKITEALRQIAQILATNPDLPMARWNEGLCRLLQGDFERGWRGFAFRFKAGAVPNHGLTEPEWQGETLQQRPILVHAEQGLGDTLQFIRFLPRLKAAGAGEITLLCQPGLQGILKGAAGIDHLIGPQDPRPEIGLRVALLDLPGRLGLKPGDLGFDQPYLTADPDLVAIWQTRLARPGQRRIGLVWQGRRDHANDRNRSMPPQHLTPLVQLPGFAWFCLHAEAAATPLPDGITALSPWLTTLAETAAAITALDLVITVDTAVAHLAGSMGRPVWLMLPAMPDWRWQLARNDSPWYPSARLFRQEKPGDWPGVIAAITAALAAG